jgi:citrate lyase beta subunit
VRVNHAATGLQADDLLAAIDGKPDSFILPKVETAQEVQDMSRALLQHEGRLRLAAGTIKLLAYVETARGIVNLREIAEADPRLVALLFGAEDLAASLGAIRTAEGHEVLYARSAVVTHAAAATLQAIDAVYVRLGDLDGLRADTEFGRRMGYTGKAAVHPEQIETITAAFTPSAEEVERARRLIAANDAHQAGGTGAFAFEGRMIDAPMIRQAQRILARARAAGRG